MNKAIRVLMSLLLSLTCTPSHSVQMDPIFPIYEEIDIIIIVGQTMWRYDRQTHDDDLWRGTRGGGGSTYYSGGSTLAMGGRPQPSKFVNNCSADPYYQDTTSRSSFAIRQLMVSSIPAIALSKVTIVVLVGYADGGSEIWIKDPRYSVPTNYPGITLGSGIATPCKS